MDIEMEKYDCLIKLTVDGQQWEIREAPFNHTHTEVYASHINCTDDYEERKGYAGLWSWEVNDVIESEDNVPWCFFCHVTVPDEIIALITLYGVDEYGKRKR